MAEVGSRCTRINVAEFLRFFRDFDLDCGLLFSGWNEAWEQSVGTDFSVLAEREHRGTGLVRGNAKSPEVLDVTQCEDLVEEWCRKIKQLFPSWFSCPQHLLGRRNTIILGDAAWVGSLSAHSVASVYLK